MNVERWRERGRWWVRGGRDGRPLPRVDVELRHPVSAWALRIVMAVLALGCVALAVSHPLQWLAAAVAVVAMGVRPSGFAPSVFAVGVGLLLLLRPVDDGFPVRVMVLVVGLHLLIELAAVVGDAPVSARVERGVLSRAIRHVAGVQAIVLPMVLLAAWTASLDTSLRWLPAVAGIAVAGLAWATLRWITRRT